MSKITIKLTKLLTISILSIFTVFGTNTVSAQSLTSFYDSVIYLWDNELPRDELPPFEWWNYCDSSIYVQNPKLKIIEIRDDYIKFECSEVSESWSEYNWYTASFNLLISSNKIQWCTNPNSLNYNSEATEYDWSCIPKILWCTDSLATNYNPQANVHEEQSCIYPPDPINVTGYVENTQVQSWSTTFNLILNLNTTWATIDISKIQIWNQFTPINSVTQDNKIIITFQKFNWQRLDVECTSYELTIPRHTITTTNWDTNENSITGNFTVVGCNSNNTNQDTQNQDWENQNPDKENKATNINNAELDENKTYLPIISQKDWVFYIDIKAVAFLILFILITFSFSYVIYKLFTKKY